MVNLLDVALQPGQHAIIWGTRGVGKTSLAKVMGTVLGRTDSTTSTFYTCNKNDTFDSIWRSILEDISLNFDMLPPGFNSQIVEGNVSSLDLIGRFLTNPDGTVRSLTPDDVRRALMQSSGETSRLIIIDEFDRVESEETRQLIADTVKTLSDQGVNATLFLVGVADSVDQLIEQHPSIQRCLAQVHMPPMSIDELAEIIERGMKIAELNFEEEFRGDVVRLAHGLPNYVHMLGMSAARATVEDNRDTVLRTDLKAAIVKSVELVDESITSAYHKATDSNRDTLYRAVLLACALARRDQRDTFSAMDVRDQLVTVTGKYRDIPAFAQHLKDFSGTGDRGGILDRTGSQRNFRYRFRDPLLPPYVLMHGHIDHSNGATRLPLWVEVSTTAKKPRA